MENKETVQKTAKKKLAEETAKIFGAKIQRLRKSNGLSLMQLANIVDVSDTAISKIETGKTTSITVDLGKNLAKALNISFNELFEIKESSITKEKLEAEKAELEEKILIQDKSIKTQKEYIEILERKNSLLMEDYHMFRQIYTMAETIDLITKEELAKYHKNGNDITHHELRKKVIERLQNELENISTPKETKDEKEE